MRRPLAPHRGRGALAFLAITAVALAAATGCTGPSADEARPDPAGPSEAEIRSLIQSHAEFIDPLMVEVMSAVVSPTARNLAAGGYVRLEAQGPALVSLTDVGRAGGLVEVVFEHGKPFFMVPVAHRELLELTRVEEWPRTAPARRVEFLYRRSLSPVGRELSAAGSTLAELEVGARLQGQATLVHHPEGWRVHSLAL